MLTIAEDRKFFGKELYLDENNFGQPYELNNLEGLAQTIQNIIIIEKGTYPNTPNFGVGISNYLFELLDNITLSELTNSINNQISTYIVSESVSVDVYIDHLSENNKNINSIKVSIHLSDQEQSEGIAFDYLFAGNTNNKKFISKLII